MEGWLEIVEDLLEKAKLIFSHDAMVLAGIENGIIKVIPVGKNDLAIIDHDDYERISKYSWFAKRGRYTSYAGRRDHRGGRIFFLHREVIKFNSSDPVIDHRNGNGLDNRKLNLRKAEDGINNFNSKIRCDNVSGYRGVSWKARVQKWCAQISINKRIIHCGYYSNIIDAAIAYDKAAIINRGEDARLNFPERKDGYDLQKHIQGEAGSYYRTHRGKSVLASSLAAQTWRRSDGNKPSS